MGNENLKYSRVIKYRAWNKERNAWAKPTEVGSILYELQVNKETDVLEHFILHESTGVFDMNGKEIFLCDMYKREMVNCDGTPSHNQITRVLYDISRGEYVLMVLECKIFKPGSTISFFEMDKHGVVVGNICEGFFK